MKSWPLDQLLTVMGGGALIAVFLALGIYVTVVVSSMQERALAERGSAVTHVLAQELARPMLLGDRLALLASLKKTESVTPELRYLCVLDAYDRPVAHTFAGGCPRDLLALWATPGEPATRFRTTDTPYLDIAAPILNRDLGCLHAGFSRLGVVTATRRLNWGIGVIFLIAAVVLLVGVRFVAARASLPLQILEQRVSHFPDEARATPFPPVTGVREVESLARGVTEMERRLKALEHERAGTQQRMIHAERLAALGELAAGLAHEIHNPLDGMQECLRYLDSDPGKSERAAKYYPMLESGLERIAGTMHAMLSSARSGQSLPQDLQPVTSITESLSLLVGAQLKDRRVRLTWERVNVCDCYCDRNLLAQVGLNLVLNAAEAAEGSPAPEVRLQAECDGDWFLFTVEDSGPGVPEELRERIFEPFFTTKPLGKGTGLGLSVSREMIRAAGGDLILASERSRLSGARFTVKIPKVVPLESSHGQGTGENTDRR